MEQNISLAMKTFILHLKDMLSLYCPNLVNEFESFETGLLKSKNRLQTHQTLQFYFNQIKKRTTDKKLKSIIAVWKSKFKEAFIEDKNLLYLVLMYLFYQIETSIDFLIEAGRLSSLETNSKERELKDQCMEKLSLKAETKLTYEEYSDIFNQPEIKKEDFNEKKTIKEESNDVDSNNHHHPQSQSQSEEQTEATTVHSCNQMIANASSSISMPVSLEEKLLAMEEKISRLVKVEEEFNILKSEVKDLKESFAYFQNKCQQYEMLKIIKAFIKHLCLIFDIPYSSYRIAFIMTSLTQSKAYSSYTKTNNINSNYIEELINIYYDVKLKLSIQNYTNNSSNPISDFINRYSTTFAYFSFSPNQSDLINYSLIENIRTKIKI